MELAFCPLFSLAEELKQFHHQGYLRNYFKFWKGSGTTVVDSLCRKIIAIEVNIYIKVILFNFNIKILVINLIKIYL